MTIGERIKKKRVELGLSQYELAKRLGYESRSSISKIELSGRNLTQSKIKAIADALGTTPSYIMGWDEEHEDEINAAQVVRSQLVNNDHRLMELIDVYGKLDNESKDMLLALAKKLI